MSSFPRKPALDSDRARESSGAKVTGSPLGRSSKLAFARFRGDDIGPFCNQFLEAVSELRAENVDRAFVGSDKLAVEVGVSGVLIDGSVLDKQMRVPEVERTVLRQLVLAAKRQPQAIVVGQPGSAIGIVDGRLVVGSTHLDRPGIVIAIDRTDTDAPGVLEVLRGIVQRSEGVTLYLQLFDFRPTGPSHVGKQGPAWIQAMVHGD